MTVTRAPLDDVFDPPEEEWTPLSPRYADMKRLMVLITYGIETIIVVAALAFFTKWWIAAIAGGVMVAWMIFRYLRQGPLARSWAYAERDNDLFIRHGIWFRDLVVVPYGRMQVIEVNSGPIDRKYGLATVKMVTAAATTDATIPGLEADAAAALRERLSARGEAQAAGL